MAKPRTLLDKIWDRHAVRTGADGQTLLYVARHLVYDGSFHAFDFLNRRGLAVRRPDQTFATPDHYVATGGRGLAAIGDAETRRIVEVLHANASAAGITLFAADDDRQGILHVVGPEQGISQPGLVIVCSDSHTSTNGGLGALAFGIGSSEAYHVLATQTVWQRKPKTMRIRLEGRRRFGVSAKDLNLAIIARIGAAGAVGHVIEYVGSTVRELSLEERLTLCNMAVEAGALTGMVAPDDTAYAYLAGRPFAPKGAEWDKALAYWRTLDSDPDAEFDSEATLETAEVAPMVTWGVSPEHALPITAAVPDPAREPDRQRRAAMERALAYMGLRPGMRLTDIAIDRVFIGSCTNSRIEDLRAAAEIAQRGRAVVPAMVVPGSTAVKRQAEAEGLDRIFAAAGYEWRESGCSMCIAMNGDQAAPGERCASTSNRNFAGRQGPGARTHLMSPAMAAAAALTGQLSDVREIARRG